LASPREASGTTLEPRVHEISPHNLKQRFASFAILFVHRRARHSKSLKENTVVLMMKIFKLHKIKKYKKNCFFERRSNSKRDFANDAIIFYCHQEK
jgi:hypothetical protein